MNRGIRTEADLAEVLARREQEKQRRAGASQPPPLTLRQGWFVIMGEPVGKPRQTKSDKWKERPSVMRYRAWADSARAAAGLMPAQPERIDMIAYFSLPASWSKRKKDSMRGAPHRTTPDVDNVVKALMDALVKQDQCVHEVRAKKRWDDGRGARLEVIVY